MPRMSARRNFVKMHGLGNDFVVVDARVEPFAPSAAQVRVIADRRRGVGCDQLVVIEPPQGEVADVFMRIFNADGGEVSTCGNAARCVAARFMAEREGSDPVRIETRAGVITAWPSGDGRISVDMGPARTAWDAIPLAERADTLHLDLGLTGVPEVAAVNVGNPHAVAFVADAEAVALESLGPRVEHHAIFPERANASFATVLDAETISLRVWERGAGVTRACGTAACAVCVAGVRRGLTDRAVTVHLDGGPLELAWRESDGHVIKTGPAAVSFTGQFDEIAIAA